jgi:hypothetical protein
MFDRARQARFQVEDLREVAVVKGQMEKMTIPMVISY